jgi:site-specific recombinase XerD
MSELRTRMIRDMALRGFSPRTHEASIAAVVKLAKHYHRSPDTITNEEVQAYLAHLIQERKLSWSTCSQAAHAFRFLYHVTLGHPRTDFHVPAPKQPQKLPEILSREEVWRLLAARLLQELRAYWKTAPPGVWLFANRQGTRPIDITVAQKIYTMAKLRAGIHKQGGIHALRHAFATHLLSVPRFSPTGFIRHARTHDG